MRQVLIDTRTSTGVVSSQDACDKSETMKPHHAAALALVGWYLMLPPVTSDGRIQKDAPLSRWYIFSNFETKEECEKARQVSSGLTICVASDDPRLK